MGENTSEEDVNENQENDQPAVEFDSQIEDTIEIEGMEEPITLNLYNPEDAPLLPMFLKTYLQKKVMIMNRTSFMRILEMKK